MRAGLLIINFYSLNTFGVRNEAGVTSEGIFVIPILCSINEAAQMLGIGRTKAYDMIAKGELASMHIGSRRLVRAFSTAPESRKIPSARKF